MTDDPMGANVGADATDGTEGGTNAASPLPEAADELALELDRHWRASLMLMRVLLLLWAGAGLGCGILAADWLNQFSLGGIPLGFWFAQQGAIVVFVLLILIYALVMNHLDKRHRKAVTALTTRPATTDRGANV